MPRHPERIAHRGANREARENTLPAFLKAMDRGADGIELDVHATADGVIVVHHDPALNADTVKPAMAGRAIASLDAATLHRTLYKDGHDLPTLAEVLDAVGTRATVYVEVKAPGIERRVVDVIRAATTPCAVHSFDHRVSPNVHRLAPALPTGILTDSYLLDPGGTLRSAGARDYWAHWQTIDAALVDAIHAAGGRVVAWTANDPAAVRALAALRVDAFCTDDVRVLDAALG